MRFFRPTWAKVIISIYLFFNVYLGELGGAFVDSSASTISFVYRLPISFVSQNAVFVLIYLLILALCYFVSCTIVALFEKLRTKDRENFEWILNRSERMKMFFDFLKPTRTKILTTLFFYFLFDIILMELAILSPFFVLIQNTLISTDLYFYNLYYNFPITHLLIPVFHILFWYLISCILAFSVKKLRKQK